MSQLIETQTEFQTLAIERLAEAAVLLAAGKWGGAFYLSGYAVELGLKSCIIKRVMAKDAFLKKDFSRDCYTHDLTVLVRLAGLDNLLTTACHANPVLQSHWTLTKDWSEESRYHLIVQSEAVAVYNAIVDPTHGVMQWIKAQW